jgi:hypothetical protein
VNNFLKRKLYATIPTPRHSYTKKVSNEGIRVLSGFQTNTGFWPNFTNFTYPHRNARDEINFV